MSTRLVTEFDAMKITSEFPDGKQKVTLTVFDASEGQHVDVDITDSMEQLQKAIETHRSGLRDWY